MGNQYVFQLIKLILISEWSEKEFLFCTLKPTVVCQVTLYIKIIYKIIYKIWLMQEKF